MVHSTKTKLDRSRPRAARTWAALAALCVSSAAACAPGPSVKEPVPVLTADLPRVGDAGAARLADPAVVLEPVERSRTSEGGRPDGHHAGPLAAGDRDGDGLADDLDQCPTAPEDRDGFQDEDGCPDPDNDQDGIPDTKDQCPNEPENFNGFQDEDGCPESAPGRADRDGDGIPDGRDQCPDVPEDRDGFEDADGCPDPDNDRDGILDDRDLCPNEPEDKDGFEDADGCPDPDNDKDGVPDATDKCPNQPGSRASGGCPARGPGGR